MATEWGITTIKRFTYRGTSEDWSNTYYFEGTQPADFSGFENIAEAIAAQEKSFLPSTHEVVEWYGYVEGQDESEHHGFLTGNQGTLTTTGGTIAPGDAAFWVRWPTGVNNSKGKPIYLRKYYHGAVADNTNHDNVLAGQRTAAKTACDTISDSLGIGPVTNAGGDKPASDECTVSTYVTTRTLKRRGRRPPTP